ncbi:hypothetical protein K402DRAFT_429206, partial [Aulographum hederae CBS 113979]
HRSNLTYHNHSCHYFLGAFLTLLGTYKRYLFDSHPTPHITTMPEYAPLQQHRRERARDASSRRAAPPSRSGADPGVTVPHLNAAITQANLRTNLLRIPAEIRNRIYGIVFEGDCLNDVLPIAALCRQTCLLADLATYSRAESSTLAYELCPPVINATLYDDGFAPIQGDVRLLNTLFRRVPAKKRKEIDTIYLYFEDRAPDSLYETLRGVLEIATQIILHNFVPKLLHVVAPADAPADAHNTWLGPEDLLQWPSDPLFRDAATDCSNDHYWRVHVEFLENERDDEFLNRGAFLPYKLQAGYRIEVLGEEKKRVVEVVIGDEAERQDDPAQSYWASRW